MENPDAYRVGTELVEFEWRQNHRNYYSSFSLKFYQENDMPLLTGWFPSQSGGDEIRESQTDAFSNPIPWQLTCVQWFELQNVLAESELPEYETFLSRHSRMRRVLSLSMNWMPSARAVIQDSVAMTSVSRH